MISPPPAKKTAPRLPRCLSAPRGCVPAPRRVISPECALTTLPEKSDRPRGSRTPTLFSKHCNSKARHQGNRSCYRDHSQCVATPAAHQHCAVPGARAWGGGAGAEQPGSAAQSLSWPGEPEAVEMVGGEGAEVPQWFL